MQIVKGKFYYQCDYDCLEGTFEIKDITEDSITIKFYSYDGAHKTTTHKLMGKHNKFFVKYNMMVWLGKLNEYTGPTPNSC